MRLNLLAGACAASMLLALTPTVQAADIDVAPEPMGMGWYVSVFGGLSLAKDEDGSFIDASSSTVYFDLDLDNGFTAGIAVGAQFNEWLRGEVEFSGNWHDVEGFVGSSADPTTTAVEGDESALFALANLWLDVPVGEFFRPYVGGGVGFGRLNVELETTLGSSLVDDSDWGFAWQVGAGVAFDISSNMAIDVGYRFKSIENADIEVDDDAEDIEKDYRSHNILLGLRFGF